MKKLQFFFVSKSQTNSQKELPGLFPCFLPLNLSSIKADNSLNDAIKEVEKEYLYLSDRGGYLGDIFNRHPELENHVSPSIVISFYSVEFNRLPNSVTIYIHVDEKKDCIKCYHRLNRNEQNSNTLQLLKYFNTHLDNIINALISTPEVLVGKFSFLSVAEEKMLSQLGSGKPYVLPTESITTLFEKNVERNPNHPAILMNEHVLSYLQLWQMAEIIAELIQTKTSPNAFIGIYTTRSPIMLAMILGVLKAEGVYVPLDPKYPLGKIDLIVTNANVTLILTTSNFEKKLSDFFETRNSVMIIDSEMILDRSSSIKTFRKALIRPHTDRLAYTMFTSGTTGEPKGVVISQRNVINYCCWFSDTTTLNSEAVIDFSSSIAFDLSVPCTIAPLIVGSTIAICSEEEKVNPQRYLKHLQRFQVTHIELTPGYLELVLNYPDEIRQLKKLNYLMLGADVVHTSEVEAWLALSPQTQIVNEYGPTETTVSVTSYFVQPSELSKISSVPIGKPAFNSVCYVLDKHNNLCPFGMKGELYAGGEQIALGYLNLSQITAEKFIDLKFNNQSIRLYRTGDEVCWNSNGQLQFFGRNDFQVKIHGYRVELSAIETLLMQYPEIHQAVVILKKDDKEKSLCAYLVVADKLTIMLDNLKNFLAHHLPNYMLPKEFYLVDSIPLKENEKIDFDSLKSEIPKQLLSQPVLQQDNLTSTQTTCLGIWQTIFNKQSIQLEDNFFDIGGDSLIALEIITSLKKHYAVPISLSYLFEHPTIASLSEKIDELLSQYRPQKGIFNLTNTLIKLSTGTYPIPLFLIHPVGGSIFWYQSLAKQLEGKLTIYGIQDPNLEGDNQCFHSIQEMAKFYIQTMFTIYQGDQFYLGGASFGATVAFEMAYQLQQANLKINFLGLMDGWAHYPVNLMQTNSLSLITQNQEKYLSHERYRILLKQEEYRQQLLCDYSLPILATKVSLFKAQDLWKSFMEIDDPCNGWQKYVDGKIAVHLVPGNHQSMFFPPNIEKWAHLLIPDRF